MLPIKPVHRYTKLIGHVLQGHNAIAFEKLSICVASHFADKPKEGQLGSLEHGLDESKRLPWLVLG